MVDGSKYIYSVHDVAVRVNRTKGAIIYWENMNKIPKAKRNSDNKRIYNEHDIDKIVSIVSSNDFYQRKLKR